MWQKPSGSFIYTKLGVRLSIDKATKLESKLNDFIGSMDQSVKATASILKLTFCYLLTKEINNKTTQTDHWSLTWADLVENYLGSVYAMVQVSHILHLGEELAAMLQDNTEY